MLQIVKAVATTFALAEAGAAAGSEGRLSAASWDIASGVDGHFPTLNKNAHHHITALGQHAKKTHAKVHHHKKVAVHRRQHRRASRKHSKKNQAKHLRAHKGHKNAHKHMSHSHHRAGTTTPAESEANDEQAEEAAPSEAPVTTTAATTTAARAKVVPVKPAPAAHAAVQTLASKTADDDEDDKDKDDKDDDVEKEKYGPKDCVSTWRNPQGRCMMQTDCKEEDVDRYEFSVVCVDNGGAEVRHIFGEDSFDMQETFDTLLICKSCHGWPRPSANTTDSAATTTTTAAPVQLNAKATEEDDSGDMVKKAEDEANKVELSTAQAVEQLVGQVKELKEQLKVAAKEVTVLNEKVGIEGKEAPALSQQATTTPAMTVIFNAQPKKADVEDEDSEEEPQPRRSLRAKNTHLKQQAAEATEEDNQESQTESTEAEGHADSDDASEGEEVD